MRLIGALSLGGKHSADLVETYLERAFVIRVIEIEIWLVGCNLKGYLV